MRINQAVIFWLAVTLIGITQARSQDFTPKETIRKTVNADGSVIFSKSGFYKKAPKKPKSEEEVKTLPKSTVPKVDIYYSSWDPYSNKALVFFRENHIVVNAYDIDLDPAAAERKKKLDPAFGGIPLVIINGMAIRGVNEKSYQDALSVRPPE
jgi:hypothetical protein